MNRAQRHAITRLENGKYKAKECEAEHTAEDNLQSWHFDRPEMI